MQEIEHYLKQKFDETKKTNTKAALQQLENTESEAFADISERLQSSKGYNTKDMPSTDFRAYMAKLKEDEESKAISSNDRYLYFKKALPEKIHLIHQSLKKSMKKSKPDELNLEEKRELL